MPRLTSYRIHALRLVSDGKVYLTRPEEFHQNENHGRYAPRKVWRADGHPRVLSSALFEFLKSEDFIDLDLSNRAVLLPKGADALRTSASP